MGSTPLVLTTCRCGGEIRFFYRNFLYSFIENLKLRRVSERYIVNSMKQIRSFFSVLLLGISLMMFFVPGFSAGFQKALDAYDRGDFGAALRGWRPLNLFAYRISL